MSLRSDIGLGLRLSLGDRRHAFPRMLLTGASLALAVGLLLGTLGIFAAESARERRAGSRAEVSIEEGDAVPGDHVLLGSSGVGTFRGMDIQTRYIAGVGDSPPVPPWLDRIPRPGEMVVSPALRDLLASPGAALLRPRYPGRIVQVLDEEWLLQPGELVAYLGARPGELRSAEPEIVTAYGAEAFQRVHGIVEEDGSVLGERLDDPLFQVTLLVSVGLLVPIAVLIATSTRLSASARDARLAAIRLIGATPKQVRIVASIESSIAAVLGCVIGVALFFAGRPIVASIAPADHAWFPSDIAPPLPLATGVLGGILLFAGLVSIVSLRRVVITPLGVARRAGRTARARWRIATLAAGLAGSSVILVARDQILDGPGLLPYVVVFGSFALTSIGAAAVAPLLGARLTDLLQRTTRGVAALLGARRLRADPRAAGRIVAGLVTVVFGVGLTHGFLTAFAFGQSRTPVVLRPGVVRVGDWKGGSIDLVSRVASVPGVSDVVPAWTGEVTTVESTESAIVVDCASLLRVVDQRMPTCASGTVLVDRFAPRFAAGTPLRLTVTGTRKQVSVVAERVIPSAVSLGEYAGLIIPSSILPDNATGEVPPSHVWASTAGPGTVERLRNVFARPGGTVTVTTAAEIRRGLSETFDMPRITAAVELGTAATLAIVAASMLVAAVDSIGERRRSFAMMVAAGARVGTLRRVIAVEIAMPLLGGVALAVVTSIVVLRMFFEANAESFDGRPVPIPAEPFVRLVVFAIVATVVATIATFPSLGRAIRPDSLRTE